MPTKDLTAVAKSSGFPVEAFMFVQRGLDYTVRKTHGELEVEHVPEFEAAGAVDTDPSRHVDGAMLCHGLREFAIEEYGLLARAVLKHWRINGCRDFGKVVFAMVEAGLMHKTDDDSIADFENVYDFRDAFQSPVKVSEVA